MLLDQLVEEHIKSIGQPDKPLFHIRLILESDKFIINCIYDLYHNVGFPSLSTIENHLNILFQNLDKEKS